MFQIFRIVIYIYVNAEKKVVKKWENGNVIRSVKNPLD